MPSPDTSPDTAAWEAIQLCQAEWPGKLRAARYGACLTQAELAERIVELSGGWVRCDQRQIHSYEAGRVVPRALTQALIALALGVDIGTMFPRDPSEITRW